MFCPKCRVEYAGEVEECKNCNTPLIPELSPDSLKSPIVPRGSKETLRMVTLLTMIGMAYSFIFKALWTIFPNLYLVPGVSQTSTILVLLSSLFLVSFYILFLRGYIRKENIKLKTVSVLALTGISILSLLQMKGVMLAFRSELPPTLLLFLSKITIDPIMPWISSLCMFIFFLRFHEQTSRAGEEALLKAKKFAIIGSGLSALVHTFIIGNYQIYPSFRYTFDLNFYTFLISSPFIVLSFAFVLYFYITFYKYLGRTR
ncbi:MAG: hypothetical protein HN356_02865 [Calditrichaeota bacterium]|nr:hypothetical protein [Calditrichota bacterium]MBT7618094.1 hypothetical protein [Calditrichota bacterium]